MGQKSAVSVYFEKLKSMQLWRVRGIKVFCAFKKLYEGSL